jgi:hypothetical protein
MIPRYSAFDELDCSPEDMSPELAVQRAAQYRWTADYIAPNDEALSRHLIKKAVECDRIALAAWTNAPRPGPNLACR